MINENVNYFFSEEDLINYLKGNENAVGVMLGNGRYSPPDKVSNKNLTPPLKKYGH